MQIALDFGVRQDIEWIFGKLQSLLDMVELSPPPDPMRQLVRSILGGQTRDAVSDAAAERLFVVYPNWLDLAAASVEDIAALISEVTFASDKAGNLQKALRRIAFEHPDFDLGFLLDRPMPQAMAWLEELPGVGPKVAAATLNFSSFQRAAFVVDTHVLRVLQRFGLVGSRSTNDKVAETVLSAMDDWSAQALTNLHVVIKLLGQNRCRAPYPMCETCPLKTRCETGKRRA